MVVKAAKIAEKRPRIGTEFRARWLNLVGPADLSATASRELGVKRAGGIDRLLNDNGRGLIDDSTLHTLDAVVHLFLSELVNVAVDDDACVENNELDHSKHNDIHDPDDLVGVLAVVGVIPSSRLALLDDTVERSGTEELPDGETSCCEGEQPVDPEDH